MYVPYVHAHQSTPNMLVLYTKPMSYVNLDWRIRLGAGKYSEERGQSRAAASKGVSSSKCVVNATLPAYVVFTDPSRQRVRCGGEVVVGACRRSLGATVVVATCTVRCQQTTIDFEAKASTMDRRDRV